MKPDKVLIQGRGAVSNPPNRFDTLWYVSENESTQEDDPTPGTHFLRDPSRSLVTYNDSPDVGFDASINPYRGCEHGCIYCYARPTHEYLGFSAGLDFETRILVKEDAPALLRQELASANWRPQVIAISGVTDPYQPVERRLRLTRQCLEVLVEFRNPVVIITKNHLVTRDLDLLEELAHLEAAAIFLSVTTLDSRLSQVMEPRASHPLHRLAAIETLARAKVPVGVLVAPVIPGLTDHEVPSIIAACAQAGARYAGYVLLRLPHAVLPLFEEWLTHHFPERKEKVLQRIRSTRGGKLYDSRFVSRMKGEGVLAKQISSLFSLACRRAGLIGRTPKLSIGSFRGPRDRQLSLFP
ncbi:MAG: radical SAM protein [Acidobacteria bacterium]|nr:MAG: radical SAM protein [Acidobacteriota bacterium]